MASAPDLPLNLVINLHTVVSAGKSSNPSENSLAILYSLLAPITPAHAWPIEQVITGETLQALVERKYRLDFEDPAHTAAASVVATMLSQVNKIVDPSVPLQVPTIRTPILPRMPLPSGDRHYVQFLAPERLLVGDWELVLAAWEDESFAPNSHEPGPVLVISLRSPKVAEVLGKYVDSYRFGSLGGVTTPTPQDPVPLQPEETDLFSADARNPLAIGTLDPDKAGVFYIVDFFDGACSHGEYVLGSVLRTLEAVGAGALKANVMGVDLSDAAAAGSGSVSGVPVVSARKFAEAYLQTLSKQQRQEREELLLTKQFSAQLLQLIYEAAARGPAPARVVSSSFYVLNRTQQIPPTTYRAGQWPMLFGAVSMFQPYVEGNSIEDPARGFYTYRRDHAVALVSAAVKAGGAIQPKGMFSSAGDGVSFIDSGRADCGGASNFGTSFSTPRVATLAYVLQAILRARTGVDVKPLTVLNRLKASIDVMPGLIGMIAAPGPVDLARAAVEQGALIAKDGSVKAARLSGTLKSFCIYVEDQPSEARRRLCPEKLSSSDISAFQLVDGRIYAFLASERRWYDITREVGGGSVEIKVQVDGSKECVYEKLGDFLAVYKGGVVFE